MFIILLFVGSFVREEGFGSLFRGWLPTVLRESLGNAAFFAAYHHTKNTLSRRAVKKAERDGRGDDDRRNVFVAGKTRNHSVSKTNVLSNIPVKSNRAQSNAPVKLNRAPSNAPVKSDSLTTTPSSTGAILLAGAMAGLAYTLCSHPLEMAAILMQVSMIICHMTTMGHKSIHAYIFFDYVLHYISFDTFY